MAAVEELERGRDAFARGAWLDAHEALSRADGAAALGGLYAFASMLVGGVGRDAKRVVEHIARRPLHARAPVSV